MLSRRTHKPSGGFSCGLLLIGFCFGYILVLVSPVSSVLSASGGTTYYVDCSGDDENSGESITQPWRSLGRANRSDLHPGDSLLFKRGCTWHGTLEASWTGRPGAAILIGGYGSGADPVIRNGPNDLADGLHTNVDITGSYLVIERIETTIVDPPVETGCLNNPHGWFVGFNFRNPQNAPNGGSHNVLRSAQATFQTAGVHMQANTHHNRVLDSVFTDNNAMESLTPVAAGAADDIGAWGILLKGSRHEIANNFFSRNNSICAYDTSPQGNSIELYEARDNWIHHNIALNDRVFSELGSSRAIVSENNVFVYNLVISSIRDARFITTRGGGSIYGPVLSTKVFNNTIYLTGPESQALICGAGCSPRHLTARNNIFWAEDKAAYSDRVFEEGNNLYWASIGDPEIQFLGFAISDESIIADPRFVDPAGLNFRLQPDSPAIDAGSTECWLMDLAGTTLPQGGDFDIGRYEFSAESAGSFDPCNKVPFYLWPPVRSPAR